jgi:hypothetical protein
VHQKWTVNAERPRAAWSSTFKAGCARADKSDRLRRDRRAFEPIVRSQSMDTKDPAEDQRGAGIERSFPASTSRPAAPVDGEVAIQAGVAVFWCEQCTRWINAHIEVEGAKQVHQRISHPR